MSKTSFERITGKSNLSENNISSFERITGKSSTDYNESYSKKKKKKKLNLIESSDALDDGWQFGDIAKTIGSSIGDLATDIGEGFLSATEGVADFLQYRTADVLNFVGAENAAQKIKDNAKFNSTAAIFGKNENELDNFKKGWTNNIEANSILGDTLDTINQGIGQVGAMAGTSYLGGGSTLSSALTSYTSAYGNARSQAYQNGADDRTANKAAMISGFSEAIAEQFFNGLPGFKSAGWGEKLTGKIGGGIEKAFGTKIGKIFLKTADALGEGAEEMISNALQATGNDIVHFFDKNYTYGMENQSGNILKDFTDAFTSEDSIKSFFSAAMTSALLGGASTYLNNQQKNIVLKEYAKENNISINEAENYFNKIVEVNTNENLPTNSNFGERVNLQNEISNNLVRATKSGLNLQEEAELTKTNEENKQIGFKLNQEEYQKYKDNEIANNIFDKAINKGANNTKEAHAVINSAIKVADDLNVNVDFTNNDEIANRLIKQKQQELGRKLTQEEINEITDRANKINGVKIGDNILLNLNSKSSAKFVLGHEMKHFFEQDKKFNEELNNKLIEWAQQKGIHEQKVQETTEIYSGVQNANIIDEVTADYIGEFFSSEDSMRSFAKEDYTTFEKIANYFKKMYYKVTNQKEKLLIQEINEKIQKVYSEVSKERQNLKIDRESEVNINGDEKYSIVGLNGLNNLSDNSNTERKIKNMLLNSYKQAIEMYKNKNNRDTIYKSTYWYKDLKTNKWKIEIPDNMMNIKKNKNFEVGKEYTLSDVIDNKLLFAMYPEFKDYKFTFKDFGEDKLIAKFWRKITKNNKIVKGAYDSLNDEFIINKKLMNKENSLKYTLVHEIQHAIQKYENFENGSNTKLSKEKYYKNMGEAESRTTSERLKLNLEQRRNGKAPYKQQEENQKAVYDKYINERGIFDLVKDSIYNKLMEWKNEAKKKGFLFEEITDNNIRQNREESKQNENRLGTRDSSFNLPKYSISNKDNQGRTLSKEQQEYFKDSKVRDENGDLLEVYHSSPNEFNIFDINKSGVKGTNAWGNGFYFASNKEYSQKFGNNTKSVYLNITNPYIVADDYTLMNLVNLRNDAETDGYDLSDYLKEDGYDGIIVYDEDSNGNDYTEIVAFESNQIKNVDNTNPTSNNDIRYSISGINDTQEERLIKLRQEYEEWDKTREYTFDLRDNLRKELNDLIRSEEYKNANESFMDMVRNGVEPKEIEKTKEYQLMEKEQQIRNQLKDYDDDIKVATEDMTRIAEMIENEEKKHRNPQDSIMLAKETMGITNDYREAGYLLQDGDMLDFSGRYEGSNTYGRRSKDHREINEFGYEMNEFINLGNIRMKPEGNGFEMAIEPTKEQYSKLYDYIDYLKEREGQYPAENSYIDVDIERPNSSQYDTIEYKMKTPTSKIINDIKDYWKTGKFPEQSGFSQFYSLGKNQQNLLPNQDNTKLNDIVIQENETNLPVDIETNLPINNNLTNEELKELEDLKVIDEKGLLDDTSRLDYLNNKLNNNITQREKTIDELVKDKVKKTIERESYKAVNMATKIGQDYLGFDRKQKIEFKQQLSKYIGKTRGELVNAKTINEVKDIVKQYANRDVEYINEEIKEIKKEIRRYRIKTTDNLKNGITDYENFRKKNFGKLNLSNDGQSIDTIYKELSDMYPYYFGESNNESDMLLELSEFMNRDVKEIEHFKIDDATLENTAIKVYNKLMHNTMLEEDIDELQKNLESKFRARTREVIQKELLDEMGITIEDISKGNDINSIDIARTDPIRLNEKIFGYEVGQKINDATINRTKHNEAERTRFLNKERKEINNLGIKARSKESAAVQKYGEKQYITETGEVKEYGDSQLALEFPDIKVQEKIKKAANTIRDKYDKYIDEINSTLTNMGYDPIKKRKDYMRHFQALNDVFSRFGTPLNKESMQNDSLPTDINGLTDQFKPGKQYFANALQRLGMKTEYDAITGIDGYLEGASNLIYHTEDIQRYRTLSKLIRDNFGQSHGFEDFANMTPEQQEQRINDIQSNKLSKYAAWLDEQANSLAGKKGKIDRGAEEILGRKIYTILDTAKKQVGSNMTGYNIRSAFTNFASAIQGASKTNKKAFVQGTLSTINNIIHKDSLIDKSDFLTNRFGSDSLSPKLWQKISNMGQILMQGTDYFTSNQIWRSKYYENLNKGMTENEAIKDADDFSARIMGDRSKGSTATLFNSKTLGFFTQFQLEVNNQWSSIIHDNKIDVESGKKSVGAMTFQLGQLFGLSYLFNGFMKAVTGSDVMIDPIDLFKKIFSPDDDDERSLEERAESALGDIIDDLPFVSFLTGGRIPVSEAFSGFTSLSKKITGQTDDFGNPYEWSDVGEDLIESALYWLLPTGYGQIKKTSQGLSMYNDNLPIAGSYTKSGKLRFEADTSVLGKLQAAAFGQYSSKNARKYFDNGYSPLTDKQVYNALASGMNINEYRKYKEELKSQETTEDKINYIYNLPLETEQKNTLINNELQRKNEIDISNYGEYNSLEEFDYANNNPEKYVVISQISDFDSYNNYKDEIASIKEKYNDTTERKTAVFNYINSLNINKYQKTMLYRIAGGYSIKSYQLDMYNYINGLNLSAEDKQTIYNELFK